MSVAARTAAWRLGKRNLPAPFGGGSPPPLTFPTTPLTVKVMLAFGADPSASPTTAWSWTDVTQYVLQRDGITITRGRADETAQESPSRCTLTFRNVNGRFVPRNPTGPYYGTFGRNTPLRVDVDPGTGLTTRFVGYVSEWPPRWDVSDSDQSVPVQADGILRRLGQGSAPIKSLTRSVTEYIANTFATVTTYWPLEDDAGSTQAAAGLTDGTPMTAESTIDFSGASPPDGSIAAPNVRAGRLIGTCTSTSSATAWSLSAFVQVAAACRPLQWTTTGSATWYLDISATNVTVGTVGGSSITFSANYADSAWHSVQITVATSGSDVAVTLAGDATAAGGGTSSSGSILSTTSGRVDVVTVNPLTDSNVTAVNHIVVGNTASSSINKTYMDGDPGEAAGSNFSGVTTYAGLFADVDSTDLFNTEIMGPFPTGSVVSAMRDCVAADESFLTERINARLLFDSHRRRENQSVVMALDYAQGHISPPLEPTDDDQRLRNDVTVTRSAGSSGRYVDQTGTLGVNAVGRYDDSATVNVYTDAQAVQHAAYRVLQGTVDEMRYPVVSLNFARNPSLIDDWLACDVGSRLTISNPPANVPPDRIDQIIQGYTERIDPYVWTVELNCSPFSPHRIFIATEDADHVDDFVGFIIPDTCTLAADLNTTSTSVSITTSPLWSTDPDDWITQPLITVDGEDMAVTAVSGASSPQTLTVVRSANGVVKSHTTGATVAFKYPGNLGL